jgi:hypothetical protein
MTKVTIDLDTTAKLLGVFLHYPGTQREQPLPGVEHSCELNLDSGNYAIVASGTGIPAGTEVKFTVSTSKTTASHVETVSADLSIVYRFSFVVNNDGTITGGDW